MLLLLCLFQLIVLSLCDCDNNQNKTSNENDLFRRNNSKIVNYLNSRGTTSLGSCHCNNETYVCKCKEKSNDHNKTWRQFNVHSDVAAIVVDLMNSKEQSNPSSEIDARLFGSKKPWPPAESYKYENSLLGTLTGDEEPLFHLKRFPESPKQIQTKFRFIQQKYVSDSSRANNVSNLDPSKRTYEQVEHIIHYDNASSFENLGKCDRLFTVVHGFRSHPDEKPYVDLNNNLFNYHQGKYDATCILSVDWRKGSDIRPMDGFYSASVCNTITVGREVALIHYNLVKNNVTKPSQIHIIGFSFGAHVAHFASIWFKQVALVSGNSCEFDERFWTYDRITGLDPAAPEFSSYKGSHLTYEDADFVDVIHTSISFYAGSIFDIIGLRFGMTEPIGSVDFYPNGGLVKQPECEYCSEYACSHNRALIFFTDSLDNSLDEESFRSYYCDSYKNLSSCKENLTSNNTDLKKSPDVSSMGILSREYKGRGVQYLNYISKSTLMQKNIKKSI